MRVESLGLEDFRNYRRAQVEFSTGLNLVVGRNAQGKTNLLEAVYCLGGLGSPRSPDAVVIRNGAERAFLHGGIASGARRVEVDLEMRLGRSTRALINKVPAPTNKALTNVMVGVFFGPDELLLVKGAPDRRRRFLDDLVVKLRPARDGLRKEFERVLRQRNALLKTSPRRGREGQQFTTLEVWDEALVRTGAAVAAARLEVLGRLRPHYERRYAAISGGSAMALRYESSWLEESTSRAVVSGRAGVDESAVRTSLAEAVDRLHERELERGVSLAGPQRDDIVVDVTGSTNRDEIIEARLFASQGEQRTCALALKLAEYDLITEALDEEPVLLLDDVFSELDPVRQEWLGNAVLATGQTIVSSAQASSVHTAIAGRVIGVSEGRLTVGG